MTEQRSASFGEIRERREDLRQRLIDVESAAARPAGADPVLWWKSVHHSLDEMREAWLHHVTTTERPDGFLDEIVAHAPQLAPRCKQLRDEHTDITERLDEVLSRDRGVPAGGDRATWIEAAHDDVVNVLGAVVRHRHRGAELTYDAYNVDLCEGD